MRQIHEHTEPFQGLGDRIETPKEPAKPVPQGPSGIVTDAYGKMSTTTHDHHTPDEKQWPFPTGIQPDQVADAWKSLERGPD